MTLVNADTGEVVAPLTGTEATALTMAEATIEAGLATFVEVGEALCSIRDARLYRASHPTFEAYCRERWNLARSTAYQLIDAADVVSAMADTDAPPPATERQARALAPLKADPEKMADAMRAAAERTAGKPTAAAIADEVKKIVDQEKARRADLAELRAWEAANQPPGFDPERNAEMVRQRGALNRLCRDIAVFDDPAEFVAAHLADDAVDRLRDIAGNADHASRWLNGFLAEMEQHR